MSIVILGIDLGKNSCSVVGLDCAGQSWCGGDCAVTASSPLRQSCRPASMAMEACCGAHHMGRALAALGHEVRLMSPEYVRPYVKAQKNDDRDAEAIAEAATRPTMRFVELKSEEQLDVQTLHRVRDRLVGERTSLTNQIRSLLLERGHVVAQGHARLRRLLADLLDPGAGRAEPAHGVPARGHAHAVGQNSTAALPLLTPSSRPWPGPMSEHRRLTSIPGIGALNATALVAAVGNAATFTKGRDLAAWLGLCPGRRQREASRSCWGSPSAAVATCARC